MIWPEDMTLIASSQQCHEFLFIYLFIYLFCCRWEWKVLADVLRSLCIMIFQIVLNSSERKSAIVSKGGRDVATWIQEQRGNALTEIALASSGLDISRYCPVEMPSSPWKPWQIRRLNEFLYFFFFFTFIFPRCQSSPWKATSKTIRLTSTSPTNELKTGSS